MKINIQTKFKFCMNLYKTSQTLNAKKYLSQKKSWVIKQAFT